MSSFSSIEVRWFFDGRLQDNAAVVSWYRSRRLERSRLDPPEWPEEERVDTYLMLAGSPELGIKVRGGTADRAGSFEFKGCTRSVDEGAQFGDGMYGRVDRWTKWSIASEFVPRGLRALFEPASAERASAERASAGPVVSVGKRRLMRLVRIGASEAAREVDPAVDVPKGLAFELTRIRVDSGHFWSLGCEAFPGERWSPELFHQTVARLLAGYPGPPLTIQRSMAYPAWLARSHQPPAPHPPRIS